MPRTRKQSANIPIGEKADAAKRTTGAPAMEAKRGRPIRLTRRQAEIIRLIADGCSDKEIAGRLGISRRTVRTHLENVFNEHGMRSRTEAAAELVRQESEAVRPAAADECPFTRPFPEDFAGCPAFLPKLAVTLDLSVQPVDLIRSCRHLAIRPSSDGPGQSYAACVIGDVAARERWVRTIGAERLRRIGVVRQELAAITLPVVHELWAIKRRQQRRASPNSDTNALAQEMKRLSGRLLKAVKAFLDEHRAVLDELEIPADACMELVRLWLDSFTRRPEADPRWQVPPDLVESFPEAIRLFLAPARSDAPPEA
jgi:DNA-binding CsgD family transcriptional regulator